MEEQAIYAWRIISLRASGVNPDDVVSRLYQLSYTAPMLFRIAYTGCASAAALSVFLLAGTSLAAPSRTIDKLGPLSVGKPCPSFGGFTLNNEMVSLAKLLAPPKGSPASAVVVSFFATWCKPCQEQLPVLERVLASLAGKGVRGILIDYGEESEVVTPFARQNKLSLPIIADPFAKIAGRLGVDKSLPRTFVIGRNGNVRTIFEHEGDDFEKALRLAIDSAMR